MKIDGGCYCGYITYEATIESEYIGICHYTDCQTFSGSAFRTGALASKDNFRLLTGKPKIYVKTAESGARRAQAFCPECGTHVYSAAEESAGLLNSHWNCPPTKPAHSYWSDLVPFRANLGYGPQPDEANRRGATAAVV